MDPTKPYTRNLIATDDQTFTLLLLCWNPEKESPIHDHPCDGCWMQVMEGSIREQRYNRELECATDEIYSDNQLAYITDTMGYHKVGNPTNALAVTLHLYAPPFSECTIWCDENKSKPKLATSTNYSEYGHVVAK
jgi:cysteine dioxygenase